VRIHAQLLTAHQGQDFHPTELYARARRLVTESLAVADRVHDTATRVRKRI
jgi:hypothetical protein